MEAAAFDDAPVYVCVHAGLYAAGEADCAAIGGGGHGDADMVFVEAGGQIGFAKHRLDCVTQGLEACCVWRVEGDEAEALAAGVGILNLSFEMGLKEGAGGEFCALLHDGGG